MMSKDLIIQERRRELTPDEWKEIMKLVPPNRRYPVAAYAIDITVLNRED